MKRALALVAVLAADAHAGGPTTPPLEQNDTWATTERTLPAGCSLHVVVPHGRAKPKLELHGERARRAIKLPATASVVSTFSVKHTFMNWFKNCDAVTLDDALDRVTIAIPDARSGDVIEGVDGVWWTKIAITAAGKCPAAMWPADIRWHPSACDKMPVQP